MMDAKTRADMVEVLESAAQRARQYYTEAEMQSLCQECWSTGVPMALYDGRAVSYFFVPMSLPAEAGSRSEDAAEEVYPLLEVRFTKNGGEWQSEPCLIALCESIPELAHACTQTTYYATLLQPWAKGEDLCKYGDLLRYVGLHEEAIRWFQLANIAGFHWGAYNIAEYYRKGICVEQNFEEAIRWYQRSAQLGCHEASLRLEELS